MRDRKNGGYFSKVSDAGQPTDRRKHVYLNAFVLYGLVAYHQATRDPQALAAARDLFRVLEEKAHDRENGGYVEFFYEDWRPITDPKEPGFVGAIGTKTYNTHLHVLEALAELYRAWPDPVVGQRLGELLAINTRTVHHPDFNCNIDGWRGLAHHRHSRQPAGQLWPRCRMHLAHARRRPGVGQPPALAARLGGSPVRLQSRVWLRSHAWRLLLHRAARPTGGRHEEGMVGARPRHWYRCWSYTS